MTAQQEIVTYLSDIAQKSRAGEIEWKRANPTTFIWESAGNQLAGAPKTAVTLQKAIGVSGTPEYQLTVSEIINLAIRKTILTLSTSEKPFVRQPLNDLFHSVEASFDIQAAGILKKLLK